MAIKIRCTECRKKVSIDEAFAGGMCRCPYCSALVAVPAERGGAAAGRRPAAPPSNRPAAPNSRPAGPAAQGPAAAEDAHAHVPMARPVKIQGAVTIVLLVLILAMVAGATFAAWRVFRPHRGMPPPIETPNSLIAVSVKGAGISTIKLGAGPIIYVLDFGSSMRDTYDAAVLMVRKSLASLTGGQQFDVLMCGETSDTFVPEQYASDSAAGAKALDGFLEAHPVPRGAPDIPRALKAALARRPGEIVLIARSNSLLDAAGIAEQAKRQSVRIHAIAIDLHGDPQKLQAVEDLAKATGGESRVHSSDELR